MAILASRNLRSHIPSIVGGRSYNGKLFRIAVDRRRCGRSLPQCSGRSSDRRRLRCVSCSRTLNERPELLYYWTVRGKTLDLVKNFFMETRHARLRVFQQDLYSLSVVPDRGLDISMFFV